MKYVRPREFRHNPRQPITAVDAVVEKFEKTRFTFDEGAALGEVWRLGEDIRLREDPRFWELERLGHFHLSHHRLANDILATRLWQGVWDGRDVLRELERLDALGSGAFHVFCSCDPRFVEEEGQLFLAVRPTVELLPDIKIPLDTAAPPLLQRHRELGTPLTTLQVREHLDLLGIAIPAVEDLLDTIDGWLRERAEWTEVARSLWLPSELVPTLERPKLFRVLQVRGASDASTVEIEEVEIQDAAGEVDAPQGVVALADPPVERHPDSCVTWTQVLRTIHLHWLYLPVPTAARFRYPRFVGGAGNVVVHCVIHDSGREGLIWLDRASHRFFGDLLRETLEWEDAGRKLLLHWRPEAVIVRRGEIDQAVHEEECRHLDPQALLELRLGRGESYRQSLASILRSCGDGLTFRSLCDELDSRQGHRPSRATIRAVLCQAPDFVLKHGRWQWRDVPDPARVFRRRMVLSTVAGAKGTAPNLAVLANAIGQAVEELVPEAFAESRASTSPRVGTPTDREAARPTIIPFTPGTRPPRGSVPVYPLKIAAGPFGAGSEAPEPDGWVRISRKGNLSAYFAAYVKGRSMEPLIPDGSLCLFRRQIGGVAGSRQGRIVLARHRMVDDPETGGSFTVKRYKRITPVAEGQDRESMTIHLVSENPEFAPIVIETTPEEPVTFVAEFIEVLSGDGQTSVPGVKEQRQPN
jgi:hypothetical protein